MNAVADLRRVAVFGATGSIGASTLDVIARHPHRYQAAQEKILAGLAGGQLKPVIAREFRGLEQIVAANEYLDECGATVRDLEPVA